MNTMEIEISPKSKLLGEIDLDKFIKIMMKTGLRGFNKALLYSTTILKNDLGWDIDYVIDVLIAELDWNVILVNLKNREKGENLKFKMCPIKFKNKVEYLRHAKTPDFKKVILKETRKNGTNLILINSFNPKAEHNLDVWIAKSTFPYPENEWKETIVEK